MLTIAPRPRSIIAGRTARENVGRPKQIGRSGDRCAHRRIVGDAGTKAGRPCADRAKLLHRAVQGIGVEVDDGDRRAFAREKLGNGKADACRATGHKSDFSVEARRHGFLPPRVQIAV
jgi:hypothetical protein